MHTVELTILDSLVNSTICILVVIGNQRMITNIKLWKKSNIFLFGYKYFGNNNISVSSKNVQHNVWTSAISASKDSIPFSDTGEKPANNLMFKTRLSKSEIQNFRKILRECGINVRVDKRMYNIITGSSIAQLKSEGILADSTNVQLMLIKQFKDIIGLKVDLLAFNDSMKIDTIRLHIAQLYLKEVLAVDDDEFELLFKNQYNSILSKPLSTLKEVFELLTLEYQLSSEQIKQNIRLLKLNPDVLRDPLKFKKYAWDIIVGSAMKQAQPWKFGRHQYYRPNCNEILQECGFSGKDKNYSKELQQILYTPVGVLKKMGYIPPELDVPKRLMELFTDTALSLEGQHFDDSMPLGTVRYFILKRYMETATNTTHDEFTKLQHYKILCKPFGQPSKGAEPWLPYRRENVNNEFYKQILTECGSKPDCDKYVYIMQTSIKRLKEMGYIPFELDVAKHLASQVPEFKLPIEKYDFKDTMRLGTVRYFFLRMFINALVNIKDEEHDLLFKRVHRMVLTRSISGIRDIYTFLTQEFGIEQSILQQKLYMLSYDLQTAQTFLNMKTLVGIDVRIIAKKRPWVFEKDIRNFLKIIELLRSFNIPESRISLASYSILLHQPDIVHQRLTSLVNNDILNVYVGHPSFLYIILRYNRVMARLECMKLVPKRKVSLHFLVQEDEETFIR